MKHLSILIAALMLCGCDKPQPQSQLKDSPAFEVTLASETTEKLRELENRIAMQEKFMAQLSGIVLEEARLTSELKQRIEQLENK